MDIPTMRYPRRLPSAFPRSGPACLLLALTMLLIPGCITIPPPFVPAAMPREMVWQAKPKREVYANLLRAVISAGLQVDPAGTNEDGNLISTLKQDVYWNDNQSVQTRLIYRFVFLVSESPGGGSAVLVNYHMTYSNTGWGDWSETIQRHMYQQVKPEMDRVMANLRYSPIGEPKVTSTVILRP